MDLVRHLDDGRPHPGIGAVRTGIVAMCIVAPQALADTPIGILQEISRCAEVTNAESRLRCFDALAARSKTVPGTSPPVPVTQADQFGKPVPRDGELQSITASASELARTPRGKALFVLDNGQVWRQLDGDDTSVPDPASTGFKVSIERGAFGSFNLTIEGRKGLVKVGRVR